MIAGAIPYDRRVRSTSSADDHDRAATLSEAFAAFAHDLHIDDLPPSVRRIALSLVRDQIACQLVGSIEEHNALIRDYALAQSGPGFDLVERRFHEVVAAEYTEETALLLSDAIDALGDDAPVRGILTPLI